MCWALIALAISILWGLCAGVIAFVIVPRLGLDISWSFGPAALLPALEICPLIAAFRFLRVGRVAGVAGLLLAHLAYVEPFYALAASFTELYELKPLGTYYPVLSAAVLTAAWLYLSWRSTSAARAVSAGLVLAALFVALPVVVGSGLYSYNLVTFKQHMIELETAVRTFALERLHAGMSRSELYALADESTTVNGFTFAIVGAESSRNGADQAGTEPQPTDTHPHPVVELLVSGGLCLPNVRVYFDKEDRVERWDQIPASGLMCGEEGDCTKPARENRSRDAYSVGERACNATR